MQPEPKPVRILAVNCFALESLQPTQMNLFPEVEQNRALTHALDKVNDRFGEFTVVPATMMGMHEIILDRIAFGNTRDLINT